ncbi:MAG: hypothetical protein RBT80_18975 [Candidatus Vecturithrix sp.]|nr:hypothetical protein [Candidatus Vecturithrix sp.]
MVILLIFESLSPGYIIVDNVLLPKLFAHYAYGADPGCLVVLIWTNGVLCVSVAVVF